MCVGKEGCEEEAYLGGLSVAGWPCANLCGGEKQGSGCPSSPLLPPPGPAFGPPGRAVGAPISL